MSEALIALSNGRAIGRVDYADDKLTFRYEASWQEDRQSFPLSLSMPLTARRHSDDVVRPFLWGLLPDHNEVLRSWGKRFQVSARNPFRLLAHVGEECAGAVQFIRADKAERWLDGDPPQGIDWLSEEQLATRIRDLMTDRSQARRLGDEGQFSLAGAQAKTALFRDVENQRWGVPKGATPTTHILKPSAEEFVGFDLNEHFCLQLARRIGLPAAESRLETIADVPTIIVKRYDRHCVHGTWLRIHQEDTCQSLARMPDIKYQNQGGPSAKEIFGLIRNHSSQPQEDQQRFLDALIFNWLLGGTDAHAKNFGFLLAGDGQVQLAPLYDLSSCLPYAGAIPYRKAKLAMKIGGSYILYRINLRSWQKAAAEWKLDNDLAIARILAVSAKISDHAERVAGEIESTTGAAAAGSKMLKTLVPALLKNTESTRKLFGPA